MPTRTCASCGHRGSGAPESCERCGAPASRHDDITLTRFARGVVASVVNVVVGDVLLYGALALVALLVTLLVVWLV